MKPLVCIGAFRKLVVAAAGTNYHIRTSWFQFLTPSTLISSLIRAGLSLSVYQHSRTFEPLGVVDLFQVSRSTMH